MSDKVIGYSERYGFVQVLSVESDDGHHSVDAVALETVPSDVDKALVEIHSVLADSESDMLLYDLEDGDTAVVEVDL